MSYEYSERSLGSAPNRWFGGDLPRATRGRGGVSFNACVVFMGVGAVLERPYKPQIFARFPARYFLPNGSSKPFAENYFRAFKGLGKGSRYGR
jgi:hypothetical protein